MRRFHEKNLAASSVNDGHGWRRITGTLPAQWPSKRLLESAEKSSLLRAAWRGNGILSVIPEKAGAAQRPRCHGTAGHGDSHTYRYLAGRFTSSRVWL